MVCEEAWAFTRRIAAARSCVVSLAQQPVYAERMILTWILVGGGALLLVFGIVWAWRNRPVRGPEDQDDGELIYLRGFNIANTRDFGFGPKPKPED